MRAHLFLAYALAILFAEAQRTRSAGPSQSVSTKTTTTTSFYRVTRPAKGKPVSNANPATRTSVAPTTLTKPPLPTCSKVGKKGIIEPDDESTVWKTWGLENWSLQQGFKDMPIFPAANGLKWITGIFGGSKLKGGYGLDISYDCSLDNPDCKADSGLNAIDNMRFWCVDHFKSYFVYKSIANLHLNNYAIYNYVSDAWNTIADNGGIYADNWAGALFTPASDLTTPSQSTLGKMGPSIINSLLLAVSLVPGLQMVGIGALGAASLVEGYISAKSTTSQVLPTGYALKSSTPPLSTDTAAFVVTAQIGYMKLDWQAHFRYQYQNLLGSPAALFQELSRTNYLNKDILFSEQDTNATLTLTNALTSTVEQHFFTYFLKQNQAYFQQRGQPFINNDCTIDSLNSNNMDPTLWFCSADKRSAYALRVAGSLNDAYQQTGEYWNAPILGADMSKSYYPLSRITGSLNGGKTTLDDIFTGSQDCAAAISNPLLTSPYPDTFLKPTSPVKKTKWLDQYISPLDFSSKCGFNVPVCSDLDRAMIAECEYQMNVRTFGNQYEQHNLENGLTWSGNDYAGFGFDSNGEWFGGDTKDGDNCSNNFNAFSWWCDQQSQAFAIDQQQNGNTHFDSDELKWY